MKHRSATWKAIVVAGSGGLALGVSDCGGKVQEPTGSSKPHDGGTMGGSGGAGGSGGIGAGASGGTGGLGGSGAWTGACCSGHASAGCVDPNVALCVCKNDPFCCEGIWDDACASQVVQLGCGSCGVGGAGGAGGSGASGGSGGATCQPQLCPTPPPPALKCCVSPSGPCGIDFLGGAGCQIPGAGGSGGGCNPAACPPFNAPQCCLSPIGPCGIQTTKNQCVENKCNKTLDACHTCLCSACAAEFGKCLYYAGCEQIADCMLKTKCTTDCYADTTCKTVIDLYGGPMGAERQVADSVRGCALQKGCCP